MKTLLTSLFFLFLLASCSGGGGGGSTSNGLLSFNQSNYQLKDDGVTEVMLDLSGSSSTSGVDVTITSSNNDILTIVNNTCTLSDESGFPNSCEVFIKGVSTGSASIIASASGVTEATAAVSVGSQVVPGTLSFNPVSESVTLGGTTQVTVNLNGSSGVSNLVVNLASTDPSIASLEHSSCILDSLLRSCTILINGNQNGTTTISASASGYTTAINNVTVIAESVSGTLNFKSNKQLQVGNSEEATLTLSNSSGVSNLQVSFSLANNNATITPNTCNVSTDKPNCYIRVTGVNVGSDQIVAQANGYSNAGAKINITSAPIKGSLYFNKASESVSVDGLTNVELLYTGGSGVESLNVNLSVSNNGITISRQNCVMNNIHGGSSCAISVSGITQGQSIITASASGYPSVANTVNVLQSGTIIYGTLQLKPQNADIKTSTVLPMTLILNDSSNVESLTVNLSSANTAIASLNTSTCTLSSLNNICSFNVTGGAESGSTLISATNSNYNTVNSSITVTPKASSYFVFSPDKVVLSNQNTTAQTPTLSLINAPTSPVTVNLAVSNTEVLGHSPGFCSLSQSTPSCVLNVNNNIINGPTGIFQLSATPQGVSSIATGILPVIIAPATAVPRTITIINKCPFTVYAGISGGSANLSKGSAPGTCPTGTYDTESQDPNGYEICYWNNPIPSNSKYKLNSNESTVFTIPTSSLDTVGAMWGGSIAARLKSGGSWLIGDCSKGMSGESCAIGVGFSNPVTLTEFTILPGGFDTYDVGLIGGVTVPISVAPNGVTPDSGSAYLNGIAGSTQAQPGSQRSLLPSTWSFTPTTYGVTDSITYYNYVSGTSTNVDQCTQDIGVAGIGCTGNVNGPVCGYAANSIGGASPTYGRVCGYRLAYLTASVIYSLNPVVSNTAPFNFESVLYNVAQSPSVPYPNVNNNPMHDFYQCANGAAQSGYQESTTYPHACGCANWDESGIWGPNGIATPTAKCKGTGVSSYTSATIGIGFNSAWTNEVLPRLYWVKQGCPTCYTYQYDDPSSTFQGYSPASSSNAANAESYTVTFCPDGKAIPDYNPNLN